MIIPILKHCKTYPALICLTLLIFASSAQALPSFSRQTGEACTACHVQTWGANLTPRGREFKLKGYTEGEGKWIPPLSVVAEGGGFFSLSSDSPLLSSPATTSDRGFFAGSVFYAGKIAGPVGAYVEGSYANDAERGIDTGFLNKVDLRFANQVKVAGHQVDYGISVNNEPGVQDLWNTNAVWSPSGFGFAAPAYLSPAPLADRGLSGYVAGASLYTMVNKLLYLEAGGYASLPRDVQRGIGRDNLGFTPEIDGAAAYWRIALQHEWDGHYLAIGHFGLQADTGIPHPVIGRLLKLFTPTSDLGLDATYQYLANPDHIFEFKGRYIRETQSGQLRFLLEPSIHGDTTENFNINGAYTWMQTLGLSVGYYQYSSGSYSGVLIARNDFNFLTTELSYTPFGKKNSLAAPWANLRLSLAYVADVSNINIATPRDSLYLTGRLTF